MNGYGGFAIALWLLANVALVGAYDLVAYFFLPPDQSVSFWIQCWLREWPMAGIFLGIVVGHLAWPLIRLGKEGGASWRQ